MKKKLIAAVVLACLGLWSAPFALASSPAMAAQKTAPTAARMPEPSCCPGVHLQLVRPLVVVPPPAALPCEQHPCCVRPAPQNSAALPAAQTTIRPGTGGVPLVVADQHREGQSRTGTESTGSNLFQSYFSRSTVRRI